MKKQRLFALLAGLLALCLLASCEKNGGSGVAEPDPTPAEDPETPGSGDETPDAPDAPDAAAEPLTVVPYVRSLTVRDGTAGSDTVWIEGEFSVPSIPALPRVTSYYADLSQELQQDCWNQSGEAQAARELSSGDWLPWTWELSYQVLRNDGRTLSILRTLYQNTGGPHPSSYVWAESFDAQTGGRLLLGDLFTAEESEYLPRLLDAVRAQMTDNGIDYYEDASATLEQVFDPVNFALDEDSLLLFFNTSEIAPYAAGFQEFRLPWADLADILSDDVR